MCSLQKVFTNPPSPILFPRYLVVPFNNCKGFISLGFMSCPSPSFQETDEVLISIKAFLSVGVSKIPGRETGQQP